MASKDYDDLLESFMNNSEKVYNDDKTAHKSAVASSRADSSSVNSRKKASSSKKEKTVKNASKKQKSGFSKFIGNVGMFFCQIFFAEQIVYFTQTFVGSVGTGSKFKGFQKEFFSFFKVAPPHFIQRPCIVNAC